jgi:hypothetical protein
MTPREDLGAGAGVAPAKREPAQDQSRRTGAVSWPLLLAALLLVMLLSIEETSMLTLSIRNAGQDFEPYWNGASSVAAGRSPYEWLAENRPQELRDFIYPPLLAVILVPLTQVVDYDTARWLWLVFSALCVAVSIGLIWRTSGLRSRDRNPLALLALAIVLPQTSMTLGIGQLGPQLLLVMAAAYAAIAARAPAWAGAEIAVGAYLKSFPGLLTGYFLLRRQWWGIVGALVSGLVLVGLTVLAVGWEPLWIYPARVVPAQSHWFGAPFNISITGFFTRLFEVTPYTTPVIASSALKLCAIVVGTLLLLGGSVYAVWQAPADRNGDGAAYALLVVASLLAAPMNGHYNLVIVALPLTVAAARVQPVWPRHKHLILAVMLLLALPSEWCDFWPFQESCVNLLAVLPINEFPERRGWGNLLISGPFFGLVALWVLLAWLCLTPGRSSEPSRRTT